MIIKLWRERIPEPFWHAADLVQGLFMQPDHGNIRTKGTVKILQAANAKMENMAGKNVSRRPAHRSAVSAAATKIAAF